MAAFADMQAAENRARVLMADGNMLTYGIIEAHPARNKDGTIGVRVLRACSTAGYGIASSTVDGANIGGAWDFLTDDSAV